MSELLVHAGALVPWLTAAAASMGTAMVTSLQTRFADRALDRGEEFLTRALDRRTPEEDASAAHVDALDPAQRQALAEALGQWLADGDLASDALHGHIARAARALPQETYNVTATGPGSVAIGKLEGTLNAGYRPGAEDHA